MCMTGNHFHPEIVLRAVELILAGETNPRPRIKREFPQLTRMGLDRVIDTAWREVAEQEHERISRTLHKDCKDCGASSDRNLTGWQFLRIVKNESDPVNGWRCSACVAGWKVRNIIIPYVVPGADALDRLAARMTADDWQPTNGEKLMIVIALKLCTVEMRAWAKHGLDR